MSLKRKRFNISLILLSLILGGWAVYIYRLPPLGSESPIDNRNISSSAIDSSLSSVDSLSDDPHLSGLTANPETDSSSIPHLSRQEQTVTSFRSTSFSDADVRRMSTGHPFSKEASKILSGNLQVNDSISRTKILSYCERFRTSYTSRDINFLRQVFSDNALIIVGHVVKAADTSALRLNPGVRYDVRTKQEYLDRLSRIFKSGTGIKVDFSDFRILRHPTIEGIYGVSLRQKYSTDSYSDDGYLFLLWDFREEERPLIHVRTWQPSRPILDGVDEVIELSDFNLE